MDASIKPRSPWLIIIWTFGLFILGHTVLYLHFWIAGRVTGASFGEMASGAVESPETILSQGLVGLVAGIPMIFIMIRFLWRRSRAWMGLRFEIPSILTGLALGIGSAVVALGILFALGSARITGLPQRLALSTWIMILAGHVGWACFKTLLEEVIFRGMAVRELALRWNWPLATLAGGIYFSVVHLIGLVPILTVPLALGILIAGSIVNALLVACYRRGRSLSLPLGFHFGSNIALTALAGTTMSGTDSSFGLLRIELTGPIFLTGGDFGVELSVIAVVVTAGIAVAVLKAPLGGRAVLLGNLPDDDRPPQ